MYTVEYVGHNDMTPTVHDTLEGAITAIIRFGHIKGYPLTYDYLMAYCCVNDNGAWCVCSSIRNLFNEILEYRYVKAYHLIERLQWRISRCQSAMYDYRAGGWKALANEEYVTLCLLRYRQSNLVNYANTLGVSSTFIREYDLQLERVVR